MKIIENILTKNDCYKSGKRISPIGMQLHTIGTAQNTASSLASYWNQSGVEACVHYCIDAETEGKVLHFLPDNYRSWADGGFGNGNLITVELMESDYMKYTSGANYTISNEAKFEADVTRAYNTAVEFFAKKCTEYGWNPTAKLSNGLYTISSHDEGRRAGVSTSHVDPTHIWNKMGWSMDQFRKDVKAKMNGSNIDSDSDGATPDTTPDDYYRVRKTWEDEKSQLGAYSLLSNAKKNCPVGYSVFDSTGKAVYTPETTVSGTQTSKFANLNETESASKLLELAKPIATEYALFPSVLAAQAVLESGYCKTELALKGNNVLGMKCELLNSTWTSPTWDGASKVRIKTSEYYNGKLVYIYDDFRKYNCIEDCMKDRCAFFLNAKVSGKVKYSGITDCKNYKEQIQLIKDRGYATDINYVSKVCSIIEKYSLNKYDSINTASTSNTGSNGSTNGTDTGDTTTKTDSVIYRVGTAWKNGECKNQHGAFSSLANAKADADSAKSVNKKTYYVFDESGKAVYTAAYKTTKKNVEYTVQAGSYFFKKNAEKQMKKIKAKGFDALVVKSGKTYIIRCGIFSVKSNAEKLVNNLKANGFSALIKESSTSSNESSDSSSGSKGSDGSGTKVANKAVELAKVMISEGWTYSNSKNKMNWADAQKSNKVSNCALFASHVLQETGFLNKNQTFYFNESGTPVSRQKGWERLKETCKITSYNGIKVTDIKLQTGDIVCYAGHVNIFRGYNSKGVATWIDAGRRGTKDCKDGSKFSNNMFDTSNMTGFKVYAVVSPL